MTSSVSDVCAPVKIGLVLPMLLSFLCQISIAQSNTVATPDDTCGTKHIKTCIKAVLNDQAGILTSPLRTKTKDVFWLAPLAGATAAAFVYDADALREVGSQSKGRVLIDAGNAVSAFGSPEATIAEAGGIYVIGAFSKNDRLRRTGILGIEAIADAGIVTEGIKLVSNRERPDQGGGTGKFWPHGTGDYSLDGSFPSGHTSSSWALARVVASQYHGWLPKVGAYTFATLISANRITSRNHFPSDVVVGSAIGYLIGGYVVRHHSVTQQPPSVAVFPIYEPRTQTYGATISFHPKWSK